MQIAQCGCAGLDTSHPPEVPLPNDLAHGLVVPSSCMGVVRPLVLVPYLEGGARTPAAPLAIALSQRAVIVKNVQGAITALRMSKAPFGQGRPDC